MLIAAALVRFPATYFHSLTSDNVSSHAIITSSSTNHSTVGSFAATSNTETADPESHPSCESLGSVSPVSGLVSNSVRLLEMCLHSESRREVNVGVRDDLSRGDSRRGGSV